MKEKVAAIGSFDGVHAGHRHLVRSVVDAAARRGMAAFVITFNSHPLAELAPDRAPALLTSGELRSELLRQCGADEVLFLDFSDIRKLTAAQFLTRLSDIGVKAFAMGFNNRIGSDCLDAGQVADLGIMEIIPVGTAEDIAGVSSTGIRRELLAGNVGEAARMLGRLYGFRGRVVPGRHLGRTIGFPTANIEPCEACQLVPAGGVYAVDVLIDGETVPRRGMANIGVRPTVDKSACRQRTIEVNIFDFCENLYGHILELRFVARLRDEQSFNSLDELSAQLARDKNAARDAAYPDFLS